MRKVRVVAVIGMAAVLLVLAKPTTGTAQYRGEGWSRGGLGNILFDRWIDNRREARGIPTSQ